MTCGIYFIKSPSGKLYVGSSEKIELRQRVHFSHLRKKRHHSLRLSQAWAKYDGVGFTSGILEECSPELLEAREQFWIDFLKPRYNIRLRADTNKGLRKTKEERAAHSVSVRQYLAANPDLRAAQIARIAEGSKANWADPVKKAERVNSMRKAWTSEKRAEQSAKMKGIDNGETARTVRWSKPGAGKRQSEITNQIWDRRGRKNTPENIRAKTKELGWECQEIGPPSKPGAVDGRVTVYCSKHDYTGTPTVQRLMYRGQGCRYCGFLRSSKKQIGRPKRTAHA
jgi:group I intron endonuclease